MSLTLIILLSGEVETNPEPTEVYLRRNRQ